MKKLIPVFVAVSVALAGHAFAQNNQKLTLPEVEKAMREGGYPQDEIDKAVVENRLESPKLAAKRAAAKEKRAQEELALRKQQRYGE